ncbi:hypothetical protein MSG28_008114 [Choristoneura fumiferana]|uniref:Uncharacterized protein n=1 Tax=Choristoneura fumiferana TaxID=7141 RepID=A0ACC0JA09_CHOFU|nr:hypothetical protein MSG28_008114 [Choristoneura fumiferana]
MKTHGITSTYECQKKSTTGSEKPLLKRIRQETQRDHTTLYLKPLHLTAVTTSVAVTNLMKRALSGMKRRILDDVVPGAALIARVRAHARLTHLPPPPMLGGWRTASLSTSRLNQRARDTDITLLPVASHRKEFEYLVGVVLSARHPVKPISKIQTEIYRCIEKPEKYPIQWWCSGIARGKSFGQDCLCRMELFNGGYGIDGCIFPGLDNTP